MKKTIFRTTLLDGSDDLCKQLVVLASRSNGGATIGLNDLKMVADANKIQYPTLYGDCSAEIVGENTLHIDRKIGDEYKTVCIIEQVELLELKGQHPAHEAMNWDWDKLKDDVGDDLPEGLFQSPGIHNLGDN